MGLWVDWLQVDRPIEVLPHSAPWSPQHLLVLLCHNASIKAGLFWSCFGVIAQGHVRTFASGGGVPTWPLYVVVEFSKRTCSITLYNL